MSFNPAIPSRGDFLAISQKQLLSNYTSMYNAFLENHVSLTANDNSGMHTSLTLRPQSAAPITVAGQSAIYNKLDSNSQPQLFFRPDTNQTAIQLTNSNVNTVQTGSSGGTQSSFLAGPFTIYVGYILNCANGQTITLLPSSTLLYVGLSTQLNGTPVGLGSTAAATNISSNQFTVSYNTTQFMVSVGGVPTFFPPNIYYTAIGQ